MPFSPVHSARKFSACGGSARGKRGEVGRWSAGERRQRRKFRLRPVTHRLRDDVRVQLKDDLARGLAGNGNVEEDLRAAAAAARRRRYEGRWQRWGRRPRPTCTTRNRAKQQEEATQVLRDETHLRARHLLLLHDDCALHHSSDCAKLPLATRRRRRRLRLACESRRRRSLSRRRRTLAARMTASAMPGSEAHRRARFTERAATLNPIFPRTPSSLACVVGPSSKLHMIFFTTACNLRRGSLRCPRAPPWRTRRAPRRRRGTRPRDRAPRKYRL